MPYGYTLMELLMVFGILAIILTFASPYVLRMWQDYRFDERSVELESFVRSLKLEAVRKGHYVGFCLNNKTLLACDFGINPPTSPCSLLLCPNPLRSLNISESYIYVLLRTSFGYPIVFDPRGLATYMGSVCIDKTDRFFKVIINRVGVRSQRGFGGC